MRRARLTALGALTAALLAAFAAPAAATTPAPSGTSAQVSQLGPAPAVAEYLWRSGRFEVTGAPVLPEDSPPDGWACHLMFSCRPGVLATAGLTPDDARPIAETRVSAQVRVECQFGLGNWYKIHFTKPGTRTEAAGWVAADAVDIVSSGSRAPRCAPFIDW